MSSSNLLTEPLSSAPNNPYRNLSVADLNGDGNDDVLYGNVNGGIEELLATGAGSFAPAKVIATTPGGFGAAALITGDFNADGKADIAVLFPGVDVSGQYTALTTMLGNGDGTFGRPTTIGVNSKFGVYSAQLAKGDFNGDGNLDIAMITGSESKILVGNGDGTFTPWLDTPASGVAIAAADLDGDGLSDLVFVPAPEMGRYVTVLLNRGNKNFGKTDYQVGVVPEAVTIADLNGDGYPEVIVTNQLSGDVTILENRGDGGFARIGSWFGAGAPVMVGSFASPGQETILSGAFLMPVKTTAQ